MECVKLKMYNSSMLGDHNSPLQPLIAFEIINKTDIKVQKVNKSGEVWKGLRSDWKNWGMHRSPR